MGAFCPPDTAVAAVPPKKLVNAAVAAEPVAETTPTPLFPWFTDEATANWTTLSRAVPEAEQSAMVQGWVVAVGRWEVDGGEWWWVTFGGNYLATYVACMACV